MIDRKKSIRERYAEALEKAEDTYGVVGMSTQIRDILVKLLREEEAVKPVVNQDEWVCGCCGTWLERQRMFYPGAILHDLCEYCPQCGKKVDWKAVKQDD